jgi:exopolyphosphatase/guanosine-5'-triphosphate,3'-diphosphate pyrophosphatase
MLDRARVLGAVMRVAYQVSAAMPDILPRAPLVADHGKLTLTLPPELAPLGSDRLYNRLRQLCRLVGQEPVIAQA